MIKLVKMIKMRKRVIEMELGNLTLITTRNTCNKNCPFCIAKSTGKIYNETVESKDEFVNLEGILQNLENNDIRFNRLVISGNGEPSFYNLEEIALIIEIIKRHINMFNGIRLHTSGNIFYNEEKFNLFNNIENIEFDILRVSLNSKKDMEILRYDKDYTNTKLFKLAKKLKLDIALTNILKYEKFAKELNEYIENYSNIKIIRLKELLCGKENTSQSKWIKEHKLEKGKIDIILKELLLDYKLNSESGEKVIYENKKNKLIYGASGDFKYYNDDFIISNNKLMNYSEENITIEEIHKLFENKICIN